MRILLAAQGFFLMVASMVMATVFFFVVILRYGFQADLFAYEEWVLIVAFWLYFIGGAQGSYENTHIKGDFVAAWIRNARIRWTIGVVTLAVECIVLAVLIYWGALMVLDDVLRYPNWPATSAWRIPFVVPRFGIFLGLLLMGLFTFLHLFVRLRQGSEAEAE